MQSKLAELLAFLSKKIMKIFWIVQIVVWIVLIVTSASDIQLLPGIILIVMWVNLVLIDLRIWKSETKK